MTNCIYTHWRRKKVEFFICLFIYLPRACAVISKKCSRTKLCIFFHCFFFFQNPAETIPFPINIPRCRFKRIQKHTKWRCEEENPARARALNRPWCGNYHACCYVSRGAGQVVKTLIKNKKSLERPSPQRSQAAQCVCCAAWYGCAWWCLLFVVLCSALKGRLHPTTLHVVNRLHAV